ncbi:hypothetical protein [Flavobacterium sp.]|uniref:hypothetical protein n=1 Tax=Flavobacterium sp. TaxID=239 RepID=UPI003750A5A6
MKKLFLVALLFVGISTFAQKKTERKELTNEEKIEKRVVKLTKTLNLNEKQIGEVKLLFTNQMVKNEKTKADIKAKVKANKEAGTKMSTDERKALRAVFTEEQGVMTSEMKKILTAEQFTKWETMKAEKVEEKADKIKSKKRKQ